VFLNNSEARISFRVPADLAADLKAIATSENNGISATARRLLTVAIAREREQADRRS
jgi:hypothetical protein